MARFRTINGLRCQRYCNAFTEKAAKSMLTGSGRIGFIQPVRVAGYNTFNVWLALEGDERYLPDELTTQINEWIEFAFADFKEV